MKETEKAAVVFLNAVGCAIFWPLFVLVVLPCFAFLVVFALDVSINLPSYLMTRSPLWQTAVALLIATLIVFGYFTGERHLKFLHGNNVSAMISLIAVMGALVFIVRFGYTVILLIQGQNPLMLEGSSPFVSYFSYLMPQSQAGLTRLSNPSSVDFGALLPSVLAIITGFAIIGVILGLFGIKVYPRRGSAR